MTRRVLGTLLILLGFLGVALCAAGVAYVWYGAERVTVAAEDTLTLVSDTLGEIDRSLAVADDTLGGTAVTVDGLYTTTLDVSVTLSRTQATLNDIADLTEEELPESMEASLVALGSLEETAAVIDQLLRSFQQLGVGSYDPEVPLDQAVAQAAAGLGPVPDSLRALGDGLRVTSDSLDDVRAGVDLMSAQMTVIETDVSEADEAVDSLAETLREVDGRVKTVRANLDRPIRLAAWGATLLLVWIALSQLAIIRWGIGLWQDGGSQGA
jgi:methyl-accepting chemotaxis protein